MVFPSVQFAIFLPIVLALSWALMPRPKLWKPFIIFASYVFYAAASIGYCALLAGLTLVNQLGAVLVQRAIDKGDPTRGRRFVIATVALDLGVLGIFKYYGFFIDDFGALLDTIGLGLPLPLLTLALPIGLSFITFQAISYTVDVRRGLTKPARLIDFAVYLSFFPHLVAGPIVRAREFLPQLRTPRDPRDVAVGAGVVLIMLGLIKKVALADFLAREVVDPVFSVPQAYSAPDALFAAYGWAAQVYCDFSGYTDIAIGVALLMGFVFPQNFDAPYRSTSIREYWRRWHMTLSRFLRDFIYIPLGGNRGGKVKSGRNVIVTMTLGGLWHGAAMSFVLWGFLQGSALVAEREMRGRFYLPAWFRWFLTFHFTILTLIIFRSDGLDVAGQYYSALVRPGPATLITPVAVAAVVGVIGFQLLPPKPLERARLWVANLSPAPLAVGLALTAAVVGATVPTQGVPPFIYFQF
jgi:alginate O-acetyltransferase complex protein AlgI